jgi:DNA-nicking Smr family endonuclease
LDYRPFRNLGRAISPRREKPAPARIAPATDREAGGDEADLFRREVANVVPLDPRERDRVVAPPAGDPHRPVLDEDAEALAELSDLVAGRSAFDIADSDDYVEGTVLGLDPRLLRRLRQGDFVAQAHLDLHGMTAEEARTAVERFLWSAFRAGHRCVLIVHGKGRNSKDQVPVLKTRLKVWLARGQWSRLVLAFTSARSCDGGTGALYVLLRRDRSSKRTIHVYEGGKR